MRRARISETSARMRFSVTPCRARSRRPKGRGSGGRRSPVRGAPSRGAPRAAPRSIFWGLRRRFRRMRTRVRSPCSRAFEHENKASTKYDLTQGNVVFSIGSPRWVGATRGRGLGGRRQGQSELLCRFIVQVFGRRHDGRRLALRRPASKKRQGTKSRDVGERLGSEGYGDLMLAPRSLAGATLGRGDL